MHMPRAAHISISSCMLCLCWHAPARADMPAAAAAGGFCGASAAPPAKKTTAPRHVLAATRSTGVWRPSSGLLSVEKAGSPASAQKTKTYAGRVSIFACWRGGACTGFVAARTLNGRTRRVVLARRGNATPSPVAGSQRTQTAASAVAGRAGRGVFHRWVVIAGSSVGAFSARGRRRRI